ncbi:PhzF family phenazine biosynthesis protein [Kitasatospora sp. NPDC018619]|uniref:PhzF family phenazine biosynthesis protein n=1 Tax=unclassified Kitasatospora TaxID=2633591 RepID=UPI0037A6F889
MTEFEVLRVFCGPDGSHGNALGVVRDGAAVPGRAERQRIARELGFSETVFVDDPERGAIDIYTPSVRLPFAGHPCVGAAWLLGADRLVTAAGEVAVRRAGGLTRIAARPEWAPGRTLRRYGSAAEVEALEVPPPGEWVYAWAWQDEQAGTVRARAFPGRGDGIDEDEATGAAALLLAADLGRELVVTQGRGSQLLAGPRPDGLVEVGGRVVRVARPAQPAGGVGSA